MGNNPKRNIYYTLSFIFFWSSKSIVIAFSIGFHSIPDFFRKQLNSYTKNPISSGVFVIMTAKKVVV
jgi:hypothetical protein